jgi:hypothetical protein
VLAITGSWNLKAPGARDWADPGMSGIERRRKWPLAIFVVL